MNTQIESTNVNTEITVPANEFEQIKGLKFNAETFRALIEIVQSQNERISALESKNQTSSTKREMTVADAEIIMIGEHREKSHKECEKLLGLSYGQVYSARLGHTFKPVTKAMAEQGLKSLWLPKQK